MNVLTKSRATYERLPLYYRALSQMKDEGTRITSSVDLGRKIGITPEQVRKDLSSLGEFGKKGVGYYVTSLMYNIANMLGLHKHWKAALVGFGHLGWALASYRPFLQQGFEIIAIFDIDPKKIGTYFHNIPILHIDKFADAAEAYMFDIGIIAVPAAAAQETADRMTKAGVQGIWNFAPARVRVPVNIALCNEDLVSSLNNLSFKLSRRK